MAADWGRYFYISYLSSFIIIIFCLGNRILQIQQKELVAKDSIFIKIFFVVTVFIYGFGWTVPHCCEKNFKPGITKVIERGKIYYNKKLTKE